MRRNAQWMEPSQVLLALYQLTTVQSPEPEILTALSRRFRDSVEQYYPHQIIEVMKLFASFGYSDDRLFDAFAGRVEDILAEPSALRIIQIADLFARLRLPLDHPSIHEIYSDNLRKQLPYIRRGIVSLSASFAELCYRNEDVLEGMVAQMQVMHRSHAISTEQFLRGAVNIACMHSDNLNSEGDACNTSDNWLRKQLLEAANSKELSEPDFSTGRLVTPDRESHRSAEMQKALHLLLQHTISARLGESKGAKKFPISDDLKTDEIVELTQNAARHGMFSPNLAEATVGRLERARWTDSFFLAGIKAAARASACKDADSKELPKIRSTLLRITSSAPLHDLDSFQLIQLLETMHALALEEKGALEETDKVSRKVFQAQLSLSQRRDLWVLSSRCWPITHQRLPLLKFTEKESPDVPGKALHARMHASGPETLMDGKLRMPAHQTKMANMDAETPKVRLLRRAFSREGMKLVLERL